MGDLSSLKKIESGQEVVRPFSAYNLKKNDTVKSTDTTPFLFRPIPPLSTPYIREKLVGASMAWNQLASFANDKLPSSGGGITYATDDNKSVTLDGTANANVERSGWFNLSPSNGFAGKENHKVYFHSKVISGSVASGELSLNLFTSSTTANVGAEFVKSVPSSNQSLYLKCSSGTAFTNYKITFACIDLTLAFGTAIADRIYSMEQAQAGSGIAWIKSYGFLADDYYTYGSGIQSMCADRKEIVGFNQWDEEWELGTLDTTTGQNAIGNGIRSKNYIKIFSNQSYYLKWDSLHYGTNCYIMYYDENKNFLSAVYRTSASFTTLSTASYIRFYFWGVVTASTTYGDDICLNLSDSNRNGTYEPYHKTTISLGHDELRGVPKLDANNNLYYDGDEKSADGMITRKFVEYTFTGNESGGTFSSSNAMYLTTGLGYQLRNVDAIIEGASFHGVTFTELANGEASVANGSVGVGNIAFRFDNISTLNDLKAYMAGKKAIFRLSDVSVYTEQSTPFTSPQYLFDGGTEEFIDYGVEQETRDVAVPVGHVTEYMGASDGTEIKDKFYLPTLPDNDGEYNLKCRIQNGLLTGLIWELIPD